MKQLCILAIALTFVLNATDANAQQSDALKLVEPIISAVSQPGHVYSAAERTALVSRVNGYCELLDQAFPRNSPAEEKWLDQELQHELSPERVGRAFGSKEYGRRVVAAFIDDCQSYTSLYNSSQTKARKAQALIFLELVFAQNADALEPVAEANGLKTDMYAFSLLRPIELSIHEMAAWELNDGEKLPFTPPDIP